jgi:hypothetical protein
MIVCNSISGSLKNVVSVATLFWGGFLYFPPFPPPQFERAMTPNTLKSIGVPPKNIVSIVCTVGFTKKKDIVALVQKKCM